MIELCDLPERKRGAAGMFAEAFDEAVDRWRSERDQVSVVNESQAKEQEEELKAFQSRGREWETEREGSIIS